MKERLYAQKDVWNDLDTPPLTSNVQGADICDFWRKACGKVVYVF